MRFLLGLVFVCAFSPVLGAQRAAAGASYAVVALAYPDQTSHGLGAWVTYDFLEQIGLDGAIAFFSGSDVVTGRQTHVFAGLRSGLRVKDLRVLGRVRPGMVHFSEPFFAPDTVCIAIFPPPEACFAADSNFALDLGGTVELFPTARTVVRLDLGDTLIRFSRTAQEPVWKHNLQFAAGAGVRF